MIKYQDLITIYDKKNNYEINITQVKAYFYGYYVLTIKDDKNNEDLKTIFNKNDLINIYNFINNDIITSDKTFEERRQFINDYYYKNIVKKEEK